MRDGTTRRHGDAETRREITTLAINAQDDLNDHNDFNDLPFTVYRSPLTIYELSLWFTFSSLKSAIYNL